MDKDFEKTTRAALEDDGFLDDQIRKRLSDWRMLREASASVGMELQTWEIELLLKAKEADEAKEQEEPN